MRTHVMPPTYERPLLFFSLAMLWLLRLNFYA
jgi:hypothetical protein